MFASLKLHRANAEAARRMGQSQTFTEPLRVEAEDQPQLKAFLTEFYKTIYRKRIELQELLQDNPSTLQVQYNNLVLSSKKVRYEDFWQRYYWRCDPERILVEWERNDRQRAQAYSKAISGSLKAVQKFVDEHTTTTTPQQQKQPPPPSSKDIDTNASKDEEEEEEAVVFEDEQKTPKKIPESGKVAEKTTPTVPSIPAPAKKSDILSEIDGLPANKHRGSSSKDGGKENVADKEHAVVAAAPAQDNEKASKTEAKVAVLPTKVKNEAPADPPSAEIKVNQQKPKRDIPLFRAWKTSPAKKALSTNKNRAAKTSKATEKEKEREGDQKRQSSQSQEPARKSLDASRGDRTKAGEVAVKTSPSTNNGPTAQTLLWAAAIIVAVLAIAIVPIVTSPALMDAVCSPAAPKTELSDVDARWEAPWWAPDPFKSQTFAVICGSHRTRTVVEWENADKKGRRRLSMLALTEDGEAVVIYTAKKRLSSAIIYAQQITTVDQKGITENITAPWLLE